MFGFETKMNNCRATVAKSCSPTERIRILKSVGSRSECSVQAGGSRLAAHFLFRDFRIFGIVCVFAVCSASAAEILEAVETDISMAVQQLSHVPYNI
jgi:hypothetical protein